MPSFTVRDAVPEDAGSCAAIYAPFVTGTAVTFEEEPPSVVEMAARIADAQERHAWLVLEDADQDPGDRTIGYAYASAFAKRAAYRWAAEVSVYLAPSAAGRGGGRALYGALLPRLAERGFHVAMACMTLPNDASLGLHRSLGFERVATYEDIGWKLGSWHTTIWMQKRLVPAGAAASSPPAELR